nr:immunoglobulin light chain junction region [Macaca mulatta]
DYYCYSTDSSGNYDVF